MQEELQPYFSEANEQRRTMLEREGVKIEGSLNKIISILDREHGLGGRLSIGFRPISPGVNFMHPMYYIAVEPVVQVFGYPTATPIVMFHPGNVDSKKFIWRVQVEDYWSESALHELKELRNDLLAMRRSAGILSATH